MKRKAATRQRAAGAVKAARPAKAAVRASRPAKAAGQAKRKSVALHTEHFPGESAAYRYARNALLRDEIELRRHIEQVAEMRRKLPLGGPIPEDYAFGEGGLDLEDTETERQVTLSELFEPGKNTLVIYSFMYGPAMENACPSCSSILDGLNGTAPHVRQRVNLAVVAKSPIERIRAFARSRGWRNLRLLSSADNTYNRDYHGENAAGSQLPALNVFVKSGDKIHHVYCTELLFAPTEPKQDPRHADMIWPLWNLFDFTPEGRGADWRPRLTY